jgi:hypothetical protein
MLRVKIMSKTDNETINKHIAEKVMQIPCWHDTVCVASGTNEGNVLECARCGAYYPPKNPEYTSDDSPRRLLNEAVDKAVEMVGHERFGRAAYKVAKGKPMTTQQIATAIYNATKGEGK